MRFEKSYGFPKGITELDELIHEVSQWRTAHIRNDVGLAYFHLSERIPTGLREQMKCKVWI